MRPAAQNAEAGRFRPVAVRTDTGKRIRGPVQAFCFSDSSDRHVVNAQPPRRKISKALRDNVFARRPVYFCDSRSPWQRGSSENTNRLLRDYFPKGVRLANHSPAHPLAVEQLNRHPRMVLEDRCSADLFTALLASQSPSVLRR